MRVAPLAILLAACSNDIQVADKGNIGPNAVINAPDSGSAFQATEVVEFLGTVTDANGLSDLSSVVWTSSLDGELANISTAAPDADGVTRVSVVLSSGNHGITLRLTDKAGLVGED